MPRVSRGTRTNRKTKPQGLPRSYEQGFLNKLDRRTEIARQLKHSYTAIADDLGGEEQLSHVKRSLVERFVFLEAVLQGIERNIAQTRINAVEEVAKDPARREELQREAVKAEAELISRWIQAVNSAQGLAKVLGTERRAKMQPWVNVQSEEGER